MQKAQLRKKYKDLRGTLPLDQRVKASELIIEQLKTNFDLTGKRVSIFLPIERFNEVNTLKLIETVRANYYVPVISSGGDLKHIHYTTPSQLKTNDWGIMEPTYGEAINPAALDFVIVPLLCYDRKGYRVGYGKGFYDRFLAKCADKCKFIGVSYFDDFEVIDDLNPADVRLHYCAIPNQLIQF